MTDKYIYGYNVQIQAADPKKSDVHLLLNDSLV